MGDTNIDKKHIVQDFINLDEQRVNNLPEGLFIVGNKIYGVCAECDKIVRVDKPILGSFHLCV